MTPNTPKPELAQSEYEAFNEWWKDRGYEDYPDVYSLTCQNAMHAAWQDASKRSAANIASLTAEKEEALNEKASFEYRLDEITVDRDRWYKAHKLLSERVAVLETALEPFAKAADQRQVMCDDTELVTWSAITVGDLRRALAAREA